jgi:hypothetical protein
MTVREAERLLRLRGLSRAGAKRYIHASGTRGIKPASPAECAALAPKQ